MSLLKKWHKNEGKEGALAPGQMPQAKGSVDKDWGLSALRRQIDRTFDRVWRDLGGRELGFHTPRAISPLADWPSIDVAEDDKAVTIRADVPGLDAKDLDLQVFGNQLTIRGSRQDEWTENQSGVQRRERVSGSFVRTITLPSYVDVTNVQARCERGSLTITAPKQPGQSSKKVQVAGP